MLAGVQSIKIFMLQQESNTGLTVIEVYSSTFHLVRIWDISHQIRETLRRLPCAQMALTRVEPVEQSQ